MMLSRIIRAMDLIGLVLISMTKGLGLPYSYSMPDPLPRSQSQLLGGILPESPAAKKPESRTKSNARLEKVKEWRTAVAQHNPGKADPAAMMIAGWQEEDLETVITFVTKLASQPIDSAKRALAKAKIRRSLDLTDHEAQVGDLGRILKQGTLLHTDIALLELEKGVYQHERDGMGAFADGHVYFLPKKLHWEFARQLINSVSAPPPQDQIVRQWYIATTAYMQSRHLLGYAGHNLKYALERFPSDDRILFYAGVLHEIWASPVTQNALLPAGGQISYGSKKSELNLARQFFQKTVVVNPDFAEAHLRLGRVMGLLGHHAKAVAELQQAAASIKDPQLLYYTSLYLGCEFAMLSRRSEARDQYERAAMLCPTAQSPLLALSQLAYDGGDAIGAWLAVQRVFALPLRDLWKDDPLWTYDVAHVRDADILVTEMHKVFGDLPR